MGVLTVAILVVCYSIITKDDFGNFAQLIEGISYDYSTYNNLGTVISITLLTSLGIWATFFYVKAFKDKPKNFRAAHFLVLLSTLISMVIIIVAPDKTGSEFIFLFAPLAIIMSNYIQATKERWFAEIYIWILVIAPLIKLFL